MGNIRLTYDQITFIVKQTGVTDPKQAIEYFAEIMHLEGIHPSKMSLVVEKLMERDRKRIK